MTRPRVLHLAQSPEDNRNQAHRMTWCGAWVPVTDIVTLGDATCQQCLAREDEDAKALARELDPRRPDWSLVERVTALETRVAELVRELAAVRQLMANLRGDHTELFDRVDRHVDP